MKHALCIVAGLSVCGSVATAQELATWVGGASGAWSDASNWSTPNYPGETTNTDLVDLTTLPVPTAIDVDVRVTLGALTLAPASTLRVPFPDSGVPITVQGSLTLAGGLVVTGDALGASGPGTTTLLLAGAAPGDFAVAYLPGIDARDGASPRYFRVRKSGGSPLVNGPAPHVAVELVVETLSGDVLTDPPSLFGAPGQPTDAAVGDLNNDGLPDLALAVPADSLLTGVNGSAVVLYNGGTTGGSWVGYDAVAQVTVGVDPSGIDIGDADREGGLDLAVSNMGEDTVSIILNNGTGLPGALFVDRTESTGVMPASVAFGDLDEDKWDDVAVVNFGSGDLTLFQNLQELEGSWGGIAPAGEPMPVGLGPVDVLFGDLDEDKWDDILIADRVAGTIVYIDNMFPPGTFAAPVTLASDAGTTELAIADLNNDGANDIVSVNTAGGSVSVILGNGDGTFEPVVNLPSPPMPRSIAPVNLDDDADLDLAVVAGDPAVVNVLRNDLTAEGQLIFAPAESIDSGGVPVLVRAGDVDNDGQADLVVINEALPPPPAGAGGPTAAPVVSVVLQSGATPCAGDCDGDGVVTMGDLVSMLMIFETDAPGSPCDTDGSGFVDFDDLVSALFVFGACE